MLAQNLSDKIVLSDIPTLFPQALGPLFLAEASVSS